MPVTAFYVGDLKMALALRRIPKNVLELYKRVFGFKDPEEVIQEQEIDENAMLERFRRDVIEHCTRMALSRPKHQRYLVYKACLEAYLKGRRIR